MKSTTMIGRPHSARAQEIFERWLEDCRDLLAAPMSQVEFKAQLDEYRAEIVTKLDAAATEAGR